MQEYQGSRQERQIRNIDRASHTKRTFARQLSILAAVIFIGILVASQTVGAIDTYSRRG